LGRQKRPARPAATALLHLASVEVKPAASHVKSRPQLRDIGVKVSITVANAALRGLTVLAVLFVFCARAVAQDRDICLERDGIRSIDACSRMIAAGQLAGKDLATIYVVRATIYRKDSDYSSAIEDITRAIELLKNGASNNIVASAYVTRGSIYSLSGDSAKALADYRQALALDAANSAAVEAIPKLQAQLAEAPADKAARPEQLEARLTAPNEPWPADIPVPAEVIRLVQTDPFFANAPPVRVGGYSYSQLNASTVNGVRVTNASSYDLSVRWLRTGLISEQTVMHNTTTHTMRITMQSKTSYVGAANGLVGLGDQGSATSFVPNLGPMRSTYKNILLYIRNLQGSIFPLHIGNRYSYQSGYRYVSSGQPDDETTNSSLCEISQRYDAASFHPDLSGNAYLITCQAETSYKRNKLADTISQSRTLFFDELGVPIRVDPQSPPAHIIQTYFKDDATETARLQSFVMAR